jgi:threonine dehydratase
MMKLGQRDIEKGVVAASAGNHALGVALAAQHLGCPAIIVMPVSTPLIKVNAVKRLNVDVRLIGESFSDACAVALDIAASKRMSFIHPFDDYDVIVGQASIGRELVDVITKEGIGSVFIPVGGGGILAGVGSVLKNSLPNVKIFGVQILDSDAMSKSLIENKKIALDEVGLFSDGTAVKDVGDLTFQLAKEVLDDMVLVDAKSVCSAMEDIYNTTRVVVEPAGALALAGLKSFILNEKSLTAHGKSLAIVSGANTDFFKIPDLIKYAKNQVPHYGRSLSNSTCIELCI